MKTTTNVLSLSLLLVCATYADAQEGEPATASLEAPISTVQLDSGGNVTRITFANGASLDHPQINPESLEGLEIGGIRRLPFELLQVGDPAQPQIVVVAEFAGTTPVILPSGAGAVLSVYPDGQVSLLPSGDVRLGCQPGCYPSGAQCVCPPKSSVHMPLLIETFDPETSESKVQVLMSEVPVGKR